MYCRHCGKQIADDSRFCNNCGKSITDTASVNSVGPDINQPAESRKKKKPFLKKWWFWTIVILFLFGSCGSSEEPAVKSTPNTEVFESQTASGIVTASEENTKPITVSSLETTSNIEENSTSQGVLIETAIEIIKPLLEESFKNSDIAYEDGMITINIWETGIAGGAMLAASGNEECLESWQELIDSQKSFCKSIYELVVAMNLPDVSVSVNILNDTNTENVLLTTLNGVVLYDSVNMQ